MTIVPRFVLIVMFRVPARGSPLAGGVPTSLRSVFGAADALGSGLGFHLQAAGAAAAVALGAAVGVFFFPPDVMTSTSTRHSPATAPTAEAMIVVRRRRRLAEAARSAISRSRRARAAARWRSLVGLTVCVPSRMECWRPDRVLASGQGFVDVEPDGAGVGDAAADPLGWGWLPMVNVWMVMSFFGWPPPPSRLAKALSAPAAATCCTTSRPAVTCPKRVKLGGSTPSL